jgi:flagellar secretion chaperone FliS
MNAIRRYAQARNETASPERLMVLLFEAALRHIRAGAAGLETGRPRDALASLGRAAEIVAHLDATFDASKAPELARNVGAVYTFVCGRLLAAQAKRDAALAREAERAFAPIADAFASAVEQVAAGAGR